jgi:hypothetical protein
MGDVGPRDIAYDGGDDEMYEAGHGAWTTLTAQLVARFQMGSDSSEMRRAVEAAIIALASQQLWNEHGERASWDRFNVERWSESLLQLDGSYRRHARSTLARFFTFLSSVKRLSPDAALRIHHEIESRLGDHTFDGAVRSSFADGEPLSPDASEVFALASLRRQR